MKKLILLFGALAIIACKENEKQTEDPYMDTDVEQMDEKMLLGNITRDSLQADPFNEWFDEEYEMYQADDDVMAKINDLITDQTRIRIFMGTWCSDSQMQVPRLMAIFDKIDIPSENVMMVAVNEDKNEPAELIKDCNLEYVPTIIVYNDQEELGRIVESPVESLESDMLAILSGKDYKHTYE